MKYFRFCKNSTGDLISPYIAYTDDTKYVIYAFFSPYTNITRTPTILDFVKFKFRVYKKKCPISTV